MIIQQVNLSSPVRITAVYVVCVPANQISGEQSLPVIILHDFPRCRLTLRDCKWRTIVADASVEVIIIKACFNRHPSWGALKDLQHLYDTENCAIDDLAFRRPERAVLDEKLFDRFAIDRPLRELERNPAPDAEPQN